LKHENSDTTKKGLDSTIAVVVVIVLVVVGIVAFSIFTIANPIERRKERIDQMKLNDFEQIKYPIQTYFEKNKTLPDSLNSNNLNIDSAMKQKIVDNGYVYEVVEPSKFKLCTVFETDTAETTSGNDNYYYGVIAKHKKGYDCIFYVITDPENAYNYIDIAPESK
jgi:hypothetical protein